MRKTLFKSNVINMKYECPICKSKLEIERVSNKEEVHKVSKNGTLTEIFKETSGYISVRCSKDFNHIIPNDVQSKVCDLLA